MRSKADETLVIVETLICPLQISQKIHKLELQVVCNTQINVATAILLSAKSTV